MTCLLVSSRPAAAVDVIRLGPSLAIEGSRRNDGHRESRMRGMTGARIHYVAIQSVADAKKLFVITGGRHGFVLQEHFVNRPVCILRMPDRNAPPTRFRGRCADREDAAAAGRNEPRLYPMYLENAGSPVYRVTFPDTSGIHLHT